MVTMSDVTARIAQLLREAFGKKIYLPLEKLDKCAVCQRGQDADVKLRWCISCGEILYCSTECQKKDWKAHKSSCGNTDRIDIQSYYSFMASIAYISHMHPEAMRHPALTHKIINSPNPNSGEIIRLPDGVSAKLILLGGKLAPGTLGSAAWWPSALTDKVRHKLLRRITTEGLLLPIMLSSTIALVSEMYTTTSIPAASGDQSTGKRRIRLSHGRWPIADFGLVQGTVRVAPADRLAYYSMYEHAFLMGQDPNEHYWIYFTTLSGDEYFLDCGMMTFNCCTMIDSTPFCRVGLPDMGPTPAFFYGREQEKMLPLMDRVGWKPRKRFSILRNTRLINLIQQKDDPEFCECHDAQTIYSIMDEIAGRECSKWEKDMLMKFLPNHCRITRLNLQGREYLHFPKDPQIIIEIDPGQNVTSGDEDKAYEKYLKKWARRLKKGKVSPNQWENAFNAWKDKPSETRLAMAGV
ncbi:hypothetical protein BDZ97DRAFT_1851217 [Flammula alnicola]|nr:hypothetical protein BDZ97DRAFT_1851217 [Flammula alnicola]